VILLLHIAVIPVLWLASLLTGLTWLDRHLSRLSPIVKWTIMALFAVAITAAFLALF
jgi:hypothetical protein